jgi:hypothetical protein
MTVATTPPAATASTPPPPAPLHEAYVKRLKARLARPTISVADARDGILDCFVSTYFEGVNHGLRQLVGVKAEPDEVARVAAQMFRSRLAKQGVSFDAPTLEALSKVKEEVDHEFHFAELPAEHRAVHDQVCTLLVAKADGTLAHRGDRSVVTKAPEPAASAPVSGAEVSGQLRRVMASALEGLARDTGKASTGELKRRLEQVGALVTALEAWEPR